MRRVILATIVLVLVAAQQAHAAGDDQLVAQAVNYLKAVQARTTATYRLSSYQHYHWSQDNGQLIFSDRGKAKVIADVQFVGDVSSLSHTWLWAWANPSIIDKITRSAKRVREYGRIHKFDALTDAEWKADQSDGWDMTAVTAMLTGAIGAYRTEDDNGYTFMVITRIRWARAIQ